jgi:hypothetical protein
VPKCYIIVDNILSRTFPRFSWPWAFITLLVFLQAVWLKFEISLNTRDKNMRYIQRGRFYLNIQYYSSKKIILTSKTRKYKWKNLKVLSTKSENSDIWYTEISNRKEYRYFVGTQFNHKTLNKRRRTTKRVDLKMLEIWFKFWFYNFILVNGDFTKKKLISRCTVSL